MARAWRVRRRGRSTAFRYLAMQPTGQLIIARPREFAAMLLRYRLYVDGRCVGAIRRGEQIELCLSTGEHQVLARVDWWSRSKVLTVTIRPRQATEVEVGASDGGSLLLWLYYSTFGYADALYLRLRPQGFAVIGRSKGSGVLDEHINDSRPL